MFEEYCDECGTRMKNGVFYYPTEKKECKVFCKKCRAKYKREEK